MEGSGPAQFFLTESSLSYNKDPTNSGLEKHTNLLACSSLSLNPLGLGNEDTVIDSFSSSSRTLALSGSSLYSEEGC